MTITATPLTPATESAKGSGRDSLAALRISRPDPNLRPDRPRKRPHLVWLALLLASTVGGFFVLEAKGYKPLAAIGIKSAAVTDWVPDAMKDRPQVRLVAIAKQTGRSGDAVVVATGYLESRRQARIGARATGRLQSIHFEEGSKVNEGETLAVLEHADMDAALKAVKASVTITEASITEQEVTISQAKRNLDRAASLWQQRSIAEAESDQAQFTYEAAVARRKSLVAQLELSLARLAESEQMRENMFIRAPFSGTVISKDAEVGESILLGGMGEASGRGSVATIADLEHLEVECDVKEDFITRVRQEQQTEINVDAVPNRKYHGAVRKIIPMGNRARATIKVQIAISDSDEFLFPDMSATVYFLPPAEGADEDQKRTRLFCPTTSVVVVSADDTYVCTVDDNGRVKKIPIRVAEARDGKTEVLSGLEGRERIISDAKTLNAGQPVKVIE